MLNKTTQLRLRQISILMAVLLLAGCKTELYTSLSEVEANEMLSILIDSGISSEKNVNKDGLHNILVDEKDISQSVQLLKRKGYPKQQFKTMGDIFFKDGMISSPQEEAARLNFALSQELSSTISMIDGVVSARVHVVLPKNDSYGDQAVNASASVFIKHTDKLSIENIVPKVKSLVSNSIEKLSYEQVSVSLFNTAIRTQADQPAINHLGFVMVEEGDVGWFLALAITFISISILSFVFLGYWLYRQYTVQRSIEAA